nr:MAG TPA: hypothetical protein [Caudoviricetes sp.]
MSRRDPWAIRQAIRDSVKAVFFLFFEKRGEDIDK